MPHCRLDLLVVEFHGKQLKGRDEIDRVHGQLHDALPPLVLLLASLGVGGAVGAKVKVNTPHERTNGRYTYGCTAPQSSRIGIGDS